MKYRSPFSNIRPVLLAGLLVAAVSAQVTTNAAHAAPITDFNAGNIISNEVFYNKNTMSVSQIQSFLDALITNCDVNGTQPSGYGNLTNAQYAQQIQGWPGPPYACLNKYHENPDTGETSYEKGGGAFAGGISAAQIIYDSAQQYNINPQVLLVMLKKESLGPLTSDSWPLKSQYKYAMGYACPDSGPGYSANCDTTKTGFYKQMNLAAWQLNYYKEHPNDYRYSLGWNDIQYSTVPSCGTKRVNIENIATLSLYIYTPYTPNDAALAAYPGTVDCGAYGNRNFFQFFKEWFGSPAGPRTVFVARTSPGVVSTSAYTTSDGIQHVITLKSNGDVLETWWGTIGGQYRLNTSVIANTGAGAVASSAYTTSDGIQHVITLKSNGDVLETWWGTIGGQYRLNTSVIANTGAGAVASSAYTTSDGIQHVITLKSNGDVLETWWGTIGGQYRLNTSVIANTGAGAVASSAYTTSDGIQHVITLKSNGDVLETWWGTIGGQYRLNTSVIANTGAGAVASSAYTTSDGIQHVITLKSNGDVLETWWGTIGGQYRLNTSVIANTGAGAVASSAYTTSDGIQHVITLKSNGDVLETWWQ